MIHQILRTLLLLIPLPVLLPFMVIIDIYQMIFYVTFATANYIDGDGFNLRIGKTPIVRDLLYTESVLYAYVQKLIGIWKSEETT